MNYDSTADTLLHVKRVNELLLTFVQGILDRAKIHDASKFKSPEKELFDEYTPILKTLKYGSPEFDECKKKLNVAIQHHYQHNTHHPEHYENGVNDMDLFDVVEMFFDWKAATERTKEGDIYQSIQINEERFGLSRQLAKIFENTAKNLGYVK